MANQYYTIVVAEDNPDLNNLLCEFLELKGYTVVSCMDGLEAYTVAARIKPHIVITDLMMETPDAGLQLLGRLREDPTTDKVGVIICSASRSILQSKSTLIEELGAYFLFKPYNVERLLDTISLLLPELL